MQSKTLCLKPKRPSTKKTIVSFPGCSWNILGVTFVKNLKELHKICQKIAKHKDFHIFCVWKKLNDKTFDCLNYSAPDLDLYYRI